LIFATLEAPAQNAGIEEDTVMAKGIKLRFNSFVKTLRSFPLKFYLLVGFLFFMIPLSVSYGDSQGRVTVLNKTDHFLHVYIDGEPHLYVEPRHRVSKEGAKTTFDVTVFYAPGQGVSGVIDTILEVSYSPPPTTGSGCWDKSGDRNAGCQCSETTGPADYGASKLEVADSLMVPFEE
jgi:hypothetical protein